MLASRDFKEIWRKRLPIFMLGADHAFQASFERQTIDLPVPDHTTLSRRACGLPVCNLARIGTGELHLIVDSTGLKLWGAGE